ncbi:MAG TPA: hypothetical protein V6C76_12170 [Drouetiella sp.]
MRISKTLLLSNSQINRKFFVACLVATIAASAASPLKSNAVEQSGKKGSKIKVSYDLRSLHNDGAQSEKTADEVIWAFRTDKRMANSGINKGSRDQYVAGLSHLYANDVNQRLANCFYTQGPKSFWGNQVQSDGEKVHINKFTGPEFGGDNPGLAATVDGIAFMEESLNGKPYLAVGSEVARMMPYQDKDVKAVATGADLDKAWDDWGGQPMIVAVNAYTSMFMDDDDLRYLRSHDRAFGGHVVIISQRRDRQSGEGKTSKHEYKLLNSWGYDDSGTPRNGWVGADELVSAMNFYGAPNQKDASRPPTRSISPDALAAPGKNPLARGNDGLLTNFDSSSIEWNHGSGVPASTSTGRGLDDEDEPTGRGMRSAETEAAELKKHVYDAAEGIAEEDQKIIDNAVQQILSNKNDKGDERLYPMSDKEKADLLHQANRLFTKSKAIYAQGLDKNDRNRALVAMVHDSANPDHINQGSHNTCNVTTIIKIDAFMHPAEQAKRFVDMYVNANGDGTVKMPS